MLWQVQDVHSQRCETTFKLLPWKILAALYSLEQILEQMSAHIPQA